VSNQKIAKQEANQKQGLAQITGLPALFCSAIPTNKAHGWN
jgi:hypothetical protein